MPARRLESATTSDPATRPSWVALADRTTSRRITLTSAPRRKSAGLRPRRQRRPRPPTRSQSLAKQPRRLEPGWRPLLGESGSATVGPAAMGLDCSFAWASASPLGASVRGPRDESCDRWSARRMQQSAGRGQTAGVRPLRKRIPASSTLRFCRSERLPAGRSSHAEQALDDLAGGCPFSGKAAVSRGASPSSARTRNSRKRSADPRRTVAFRTGPLADRVAAGLTPAR